MKTKLRFIVSLFFLGLSQGEGFSLYGHQNHGESHILGGNDTDISEIPYQVSLLQTGYFPLCSGVIITSRHVITAGHCLDELTPPEVFVRAGSSHDDRGGVILTVSKFHIHPDFAIRIPDYDVAVLELGQRLRFSSTIQPVSLAKVEPEPGSVGRVSGWGLTTEQGSPPEILQSVFVPVVERKACQKMVVYLHITPRMICAGGIENEDSCNGDSGGPLVIDGKLAGLVSIGFGCGLKGYPAVYTNIAYPKIIDFLKKFGATIN